MARPKRPKKKLRGKLPTPEAAKEQPTSEVHTPVSEVETRDARDVAMFKDWLMGKTYTELAEAYKMSHTNVCNIAKKYNWRGLRKELRTRQFNAAIDRIRDMTVFIQDALEADIRKLVQDAIEAKRGLSKEERDHLRSMYDRTLKEIRLAEGQPTEIGTGPVQVEIVLPAGAKRFGLIPPDPKVKVIEADKNEKPTVDLDSIEDDVKGKIK